jgi:ribosome-associated protein
MTEKQIKPPEELIKLVIDALEDMKAIDIKTIDVIGKSSMTDVIIIATGRSTTHVKAIANSVVMQAKHSGHQPLGTEGEQAMEWMLVDLSDVVVHVMLQDIRDFYNLEKLWETSSEKQKEKSGDSAAS